MSALTELEKQMKIENLFVTWQQRSAQSNMPISVSTRHWQKSCICNHGNGSRGAHLRQESFAALFLPSPELQQVFLLLLPDWLLVL